MPCAPQMHGRLFSGRGGPRVLRNKMEFDLLKGVLSFVEDDDLPMLAVKAKQNLDKRYLPPLIDSAWVKEYGALEGPQPDHLYGYRHCKDSDSTTTAFSIGTNPPSRSKTLRTLVILQGPINRRHHRAATAPTQTPASLHSCTEPISAPRSSISGTQSSCSTSSPSLHHLLHCRRLHVRLPFPPPHATHIAFPNFCWFPRRRYGIFVTPPSISITERPDSVLEELAATVEG
jgi:hypothetical protein